MSLNLTVFLDKVQETKRVHKKKCADLAHELIKLIRHFNFFEHDWCLIEDLAYETMMEAASEESNLISVLNKNNIKQSGYYYVDIRHYCKYQTAKELKKIMASSIRVVKV